MSINVELPDGTKKQFDDGISPFDIAKGISEGLAREAVAAEVNGEIRDIKRPLDGDCQLKIIKGKDEAGLMPIRHTAAHVMAQAVVELFPQAKPTIGPVIDEGFYYDFEMDRPFTPEDLEKIEQRSNEIIKKKLEMSRKDVSKDEAKNMFKDNPYKIELIDELEDGEITIYDQVEWSDLCRGPHVPNLGFIGGFKVLRNSGAYWRGDSSKQQLQRIYGTAFATEKELRKFLQLREEASKRDHRKLGKDLDLVTFHPESPGNAFFHPKGTVVYKELLKLIREQYDSRGYDEVMTPNIFHKSLWEQSGHWDHYRENMFLFQIDNQDYSLKPMNCPGHVLMYKQEARSYRDLPLRYADFGKLHRNELAGVLGGLTRLRGFCQDDAHVFCTHEQIEQEIVALLNFIKELYEIFGFEYQVELSTKPDKAIGDPKAWETAEAALKKALDENKINYQLNEGDGAFYGPKIDFHILDALDRSWQCGTIQLDFNLPNRFKATYESKDGNKVECVMIHRALFGSLERFIGILIEQYAGKFPPWLAPEQVVLMPIADRHHDATYAIRDTMKAKGIRVKVDDRTESVSKKVRDNQVLKIPYMLTIGDKEVEANSVSIRTRDGEVKHGVAVDDFIKKTAANIKSRSLDLAKF